jgi:Protein of unknown function (DUF5672)
MAEKVAIVIPVYKDAPSASELLSLQQTCAIFATDHDLCLLYPEGISLEHYQPFLQGIKMIPLDPKHFTGIRAYNQMLVAPWFYQLFSKYQYLLICQLDVFVFRNDLAQWTQKQYDYVGAPWIVEPPQTKQRVLLNLGKHMRGKVGNGGFSLRSVPFFKRYAWLAQWIQRLIGKNEDFVWCVVLPKLIGKMRFPTADEALHFCIELEPEQSVERIGAMPFAVHAREKYAPDFWWPLIEKHKKVTPS